MTTAGSQTSRTEFGLRAIALKRGREARLKSGHPWIFAGDLAEPLPADLAGAPVAVLDHRGGFLAIAVASGGGGLVLRVLTRQREVIDQAWLAGRLSSAIALRRRWLGEVEGVRLVNAESDGLPALIVDRYGPFLSVQSLSAGADRMLPNVVEELVNLLSPVGIYERSDVTIRALEGLPERTGVLWGEAPPDEQVIQEGKARFLVDIKNGQKTGFFLDQRPNRQRLQTLCGGKRVLNTFCYSGGFSIPAAIGGAASVVGVDVSASALELARRNAEINKVGDRCQWIEANAFDYLRELDRDRKRFDVVVLDPPAFTKTRQSVPGALRGYKEINLRALKILEPGGLLVSSSCSHHVDAEAFLAVIAEAAADAGRHLRMVDYTGPGPDHPSLPAAPETRYLKCFWGVVS